MLHYATALRSNSIGQRRLAVKELDHLGTRAPVAAFEFLLPVLDDPDEETRTVAVKVLINLGRGEGREAVLQYLAWAIQQEGPIRMRALRIIGQLGLAADALAEPLIGVLQTENPIVARMAAEALVSIGPSAREAVLPLQEHAYPVVQREVRRILEKLATA